MSSFLMNAPSAYNPHAVVVDPKFPPSEEYSQGSYMSPSIAPSDYYGGQQYGYQSGTPYSATTMVHIATNGNGESI